MHPYRLFNPFVKSTKLDGKQIRTGFDFAKTMRDQKADTVEGILQKLGPNEKGKVEKLRSIVKRTFPNAVETIKWGNITYLLDGKNLAWLIAYRDHIDLGFFKGAMLKSKRLEGTGKGLRHIKVRDETDIDESEFSRLLRDAAKIT